MKPSGLLYGGGLRSHIEIMALLKIARMGHPVLRASAAPVEDPAAPWVRQLVEDMLGMLFNRALKMRTDSCEKKQIAVRDGAGE